MKHVVALLVAIGLPLAATAQAPSPAPPAITATGRGVARAPVTTALLRVVARGVVDESGFVEAVRAAGVENPVSERGRPTPAGVPVLSVRGRISDATRPRLDAVTAAIARYGDSHAGTLFVDVRFYGPAADCPAIEQHAREAALADARRRAAALAAMNGTAVGAQLAVAETGGCPQVGPSGGAFAIDVSTMTMRVAVEETITFAATK